MASSILSDNGVTSGSAGIKTSADSTGVLALQTTTAGGTATTAITVDTSQNVGIGNTAPSAKLDVSGSAYVRGDSSNATFTSAGVFAIKRSTGDPYISLHGNTGSRIGYLQMQDGGICNLSVEVNQPLAFQTNATERMRIDSSGNVGVGATSSGSRFHSESSANQSVGYFKNTNASNTNDAIQVAVSRNTTDGSYRAFAYYNAGAGAYKFWVLDSGNCQNTNGSYGSFSDIKLKDNIVDATPKLASLMQVKVRNYNLKSDPTLKQIGVIAQELEQVFPTMVEESTDRDSEGNDLGTKTKSVKYSVFVPMLIKAMQEQQALITAQAETINALTARIVALESK